MAPGEIYLAHFPFGGGPGMKLRPVLLLSEPVGSIPEVLVAYVSSVVPAPLLPSDILIDTSSPAHAGTNLKTVSVLRLHKLATIHRRSVVRSLGKVSAETAAEIAVRLRVLLGL
jgi:mRNA-degrading endonuclease toxin of MazEF toxin-antitoxin module